MSLKTVNLAIFFYAGCVIFITLFMLKSTLKKISILMDLRDLSVSPGFHNSVNNPAANRKQQQDPDYTARDEGENAKASEQVDNNSNPQDTAKNVSNYFSFRFGRLAHTPYLSTLSRLSFNDNHDMVATKMRFARH
jgi:hypothetical protein